MCPINTYQPFIASTNCTNCTTGRFSGLGSTDCTWCGKSEYEDLDEDNNKICKPCNEGTYSPVGLFCMDCAAGYATENRVDLCPNSEFAVHAADCQRVL